MANLLSWGLAILFYGVGDTILTFVAVQYENIEEASLVTRRLLGANPTLKGLLILKIAAFSVFIGGYILFQGNQYRDLVPIALVALGIYAVYNNGRAINRERQIQN
jgi:hypothetical protein